jgi:putative N6-adenine-specific DNA methylase
VDSAPEKISAFEKRLKRQVIGKPHRFLAVVPLGFEQTFIDETCHPEGNEGFGQEPFHIVGDGKVEFSAKLVEAWKIVAYSRIANRVLMHISDFKAENFRDLERKASEIPWELFLSQKDVDIHVTCKHSRLYHSDAVAERLYKVIEGGSAPLAAAPAGASATPSPKGSTPKTPKAEGNVPPQNIYVTLIDDRCTVWLDLAGEELYKRGHERFVNDAPLKETIAAAMIFESISTLHIIHHQSSIINYPLSITLIDPMSGSGTFSLEAAYMANGFIPGKCRDFALMHQPAFKQATWDFLIRREERHPEQREGSRADVYTSPIRKILTSDISEKAVEIIRHNASISPLATVTPDGTALNPQHRDFFSYTAAEIADACPEGSSPVIVLNPPYGKRLDFDAPKLYTKIGKKLAELARELAPLGNALTVAILAPKDDPRPGSKYTCTANLLRECPALDAAKNRDAKCIVTSHGGLSLNAIFAKI